MPRRRAEDLPLTVLERAWADAYLVHGEATRAATEAGYVGNYNVLKQQGYKNKNNPKIKKYISEYYEAKIAPPEEVVAVLSDHMRGTLDDFIDDKEYIDLEKARQKGSMRLLKKYKTKVTRRTDKHGVTETMERSIEIYDAQKAASILAEIHGLKKAPVEEGRGDEPTAEEVEEARAKVAASPPKPAAPPPKRKGGQP